MCSESPVPRVYSLTQPVASVSSSGHTTGTVMCSPVIVWDVSVVAQIAGSFNFRYVPMDYDILPWRGQLLRQRQLSVSRRCGVHDADCFGNRSSCLYRRCGVAVSSFQLYKTSVVRNTRFGHRHWQFASVDMTEVKVLIPSW